MGDNLMIKINLITIGDIKEKYLKDAIAEYTKRLSRFCELKIVELKETIPTDSSQASIEQALLKDAKNLEKHLKGHIIALCVEGKQWSSEELASNIKSIANHNSEISLIIGASNGLHNSIKAQAKDKLSFSKMTFPHQLMRVIALEQIYRAFTILNNIAYHK